MLDTPRTNSLYNLSRIFRLTERMSENGITTVPHINASTESDWKKWEGVIKGLQDVRMVCMEFETGLSQSGLANRGRGVQFLQRFDRLQQVTGRRLHPVAIGGAGWMRELAGVADFFTAVDSTPFMKTVHQPSPAQKAGVPIGELVNVGKENLWTACWLKTSEFTGDSS